MISNQVFSGFEESKQKKKSETVVVVIVAFSECEIFTLISVSPISILL